MARFYDYLTRDVDYKKISLGIESLIGKYGVESPLILDLACGTGSLTVELSKAGFDMIGLDISPEMLNIARNKSLSEKQDILFINQDMTEFELYGTVGAIVCILDAINHITSPGKLGKMFANVCNYLDNGGLFIFDIITPAGFEKILRKQLYTDENDNSLCIWQCKKNGSTNTVDYDISVFFKESDFRSVNKKTNENLYLRLDDYCRERIYSPAFIKSCIKKAGLILVETWDGFNINSTPHKHSRRITLVCSKP